MFKVVINCIVVTSVTIFLVFIKVIFFQVVQSCNILASILQIYFSRVVQYCIDAVGVVRWFKIFKALELY